jgi:hypothetical protein
MAHRMYQKSFQNYSSHPYHQSKEYFYGGVDRVGTIERLQREIQLMRVQVSKMRNKKGKMKMQNKLNKLIEEFEAHQKRLTI